MGMRGQSVREAYTVARRWLAVSRNIGGAKRGRAWALLYDHRFSIAQRLLRVFFGIQRTASSSRLVDIRFAVCPGLPVVCLTDISRAPVENPLEAKAPP